MAQRPADREVFEHREERVVTDELLALARSRIGAELPVHAPYNEEASADGIRHFAHGMGDDNPIYCDSEYAGKTRWGRVMAPPVFYRTMGISPRRERTQEERERARDPLSGIHSWYSGDTIRFLQPIHSGDRLTARRFRADYIEKRSEFAGAHCHRGHPDRIPEPAWRPGCRVGPEDHTRRPSTEVGRAEEVRRHHPPDLLSRGHQACRRRLRARGEAGELPQGTGRTLP